MAFPIKEYVDSFDETYGKYKNRGEFGHLVIRDSNTAGEDYLLVGLNNNETDSLDMSIRLNEKQVRKVMRGLQCWLDRVAPATISADLRASAPLR